MKCWECGRTLDNDEAVVRLAIGYQRKGVNRVTSAVNLCAPTPEQVTSQAGSPCVVAFRSRVERVPGRRVVAYE